MNELVTFSRKEKLYVIFCDGAGFEICPYIYAVENLRGNCVDIPQLFDDFEGFWLEIPQLCTKRSYRELPIDGQTLNQ